MVGATLCCTYEHTAIVVTCGVPRCSRTPVGRTSFSLYLCEELGSLVDNVVRLELSPGPGQSDLWPREEFLLGFVDLT